TLSIVRHCLPISTLCPYTTLFRSGLIKSGWGWLKDKFSSHEEEMGNMSKEMTEASKEELSSYQEGIESEASDRAKKEIAEMQGMSDKASKDAKKQVEESAGKTRDNIKKDVDSADRK